QFAASIVAKRQDVARNPEPKRPRRMAARLHPALASPEPLTMNQCGWRPLRLAISGLLFVGTISSCVAHAATHYVNNTGAPAYSNNAALGTEAQPCCTIGFGIGQLHSGDELVVKQGTYNEDVFISGPAGTPSANTIIRTFPGHVVTIRGTGNSGRVK